MDDNDEPVTTLVPRDYQLEMYERARGGNYLLVLETGLGKTLVAGMLIKDVLEKERKCLEEEEEYRKKFIVYLVNNVHLVTQQSKAIQSAIGEVSIHQFYGDLGVDLRSEETWIELAHSAEVLIMTAQIFLNVLRHGFLSMDRVSFLLFDECHHARKDHPFNMIMQEFYRPAREKPQIFGMTASLTTNSKLGSDLAQYELAHNLCATIITPTLTEQLEESISAPEHRFIGYHPSSQKLVLPALQALMKYFEGFKVLDKIRGITETVLSELGYWAGNWIFLELMSEISHHHRRDTLIREVVGEQELSLQLEALGVWEEYRPSVLAIVEGEVLEDSVAPKVLILINQLTQLLHHHGSHFRGIIFVPMRSVALILDLLLKKLLNGAEFVRSGVLLGHGTSQSFSIFQMNRHKQEAVIRNFKDGIKNLLIATRVAEEGLDIQPCNVVICFDTIHTLVSYIQSRGRARAKDSTFVVMYDQSRPNERIHDLMKLEKSLPTLIRNPAQSQDRMSASNFPEYVVPSTGAKITFNSAVGLVMFYCSHLRGDAYTSNQPEWHFHAVDSGFRCHLVLPSSCSVRFVDGDVFPSKSRAKQSAAWKGCVDLHQRQAIDDHLLPHCEFPEEFGPQLDPSEFNALGTHKVQRHYSAKLPELWNLESKALPTELFVNHVQLDISGRRPFALATRRPLPTLGPIQLMAKAFTVDAIVQPALDATDFSPQQIIQLASYSEFLISAVLRKRLACPASDMVYFFIPLLPDAITIDWAAVENITPTSLTMKKMGDSSLVGRIVSHFLDNNRLHLVTEVRHDLDAESPIVADKNKDVIGLAPYILSKFQRKVKHPTLPLLETEHVPLTTNYLFFQPEACVSSKRKRSLYKPLFLLQENCMLYPIPYDIFLSALVLPSLLSRIDALLLAGEVKESFGLVDTCDKYLAEALTLPSASLAMDYERLELLGDAFLKFMATVYLYITRPKDDEGKMHCLRIRKICNKILFSKCTQLGLASYFNWKPLDKARWRPPNFINSDSPDDLALSEVRLNDKCLADVMEAILGAAVASGGEVAGLRCIMSLGLCFDDRAGWEGIRNMYAVPKSHYSSSFYIDLNSIQDKLGYKFRSPQLLYEALTHPSSRNVSTNYQRLEFLGDAVLDYLVVRGLAKNFPAMPPGHLTDLKALLVDNPTLARISVDSDLPRHLIHSSDPLANAIEILLPNPDATHRYHNSRDRSLFPSDIPKAFSDIIESIVGAVFIDSGMHLETAAALIQRIALPSYRQILSTTTSFISKPNKHLIRYFNQAGCRALKYTYFSKSHQDPLHPSSSSLSSSPSLTMVSCELTIHNRLVAIGLGCTQSEARNIAASDLLRQINVDPKLLNGCKCRIEAESSVSCCEVVVEA